LACEKEKSPTPKQPTQKNKHSRKNSNEFAISFEGMFRHAQQYIPTEYEQVKIIGLWTLAAAEQASNHRLLRHGLMCTFKIQPRRLPGFLLKLVSLYLFYHCIHRRLEKPKVSVFIVTWFRDNGVFCTECDVLMTETLSHSTQM
jgi:hypothetical protein